MNGFESIFNTATIGTFVGTTAVVAIVSSMPKPGTSPTWGIIYKWLYDTLQAIVSVKTAHPAPTENPTQAATPPTQNKETA